MSNRWIVLCVACLCLACVGLTGVASDAAVAQSTATPNGTTNDTVQHEDPDSVSDSGDVQQLRRWLGDRLDEQLSSSTVALSEGEYERARDALGEDYDSRLEQYVDVAGDTGDRGDDDAGETYREVTENQRNLTTQLQRFEQARERYQSARREGNTSEARAAAREMARLGDRINDTGTSVAQGYARLGNQTGIDTTVERTAVRNVTTNTTETATTVRRQTFVETNLTVLDATRTIAYDDPLRVSGRLTMANGTAVANERLLLTVAGRPRPVTTDADGRFDLSYRPRTLPRNASEVTVQYVPDDASIYLGSNATLPVEVEQVAATLTVRNATEETSYGRPAGGTALLEVQGEPVEGVPLTATLDGLSLGRATTDERGRVRLRSNLSARVSPGERSLLVSMPLSNRAITTAGSNTTVDVSTTPTALSIDATESGQNVSLTGQLTTEGGEPVGSQTVSVTRGDSVVTTVRTDEDGRFDASLPTDGSDATVDVGARFDGSGTNLESSRATVTISTDVNASESGVVNWLFGDGRWFTIAAGVVILAGGGLFVRRRRTSEEESEDAVDRPTPTRTATPAADDALATALDRAERFLDGGAAGAAVRAAYAGVRDGYLDGSATGTHWDLLEQSESLGDAERTALERIVEAYERAAFSPTGPDRDDATATLTAARSLLGRDEIESDD
ncbi:MULTISPECIES: hypothetical protein [Halomicrobium]|uniref:DUF4129 domain-containing protein n=2 Tax=Halomicrobium mukohataei TaxID=57705 RepID=C7NW88_HALMD|nr:MULTISPECIES: hypothetical protein [Halomicrobium]ACV46229.1 conserved hypothetical protein [Halomicrobium mukohataei DSM 12286]QCD64791.1 hypothetical protein E5139_03745 [Halomicrobium mukohataei]QFR19598.1 hypothetical protein GBQ70_03745 [Halomicrobium sp. ZPS1]